MCACSMRCGTVKIADTDRDRFGTAFEVRSNRCGKDTELIFISRFYTDNTGWYQTYTDEHKVLRLNRMAEHMLHLL